MEVNLVGDAAENLRALLPLLEHKTRRSWRDKVEGWRDRGLDLAPSRKVSTGCASIGRLEPCDPAGVHKGIHCMIRTPPCSLPR
ncbi:hypothetical protein DVB73_02950 [Pseudomonas plecoglossicida]|uniref:Uncharacterized protein n=1 Tax=Pseudomonas plecoglossicida TaxID=70775 RepID=A0AAD0QYR2_PSEDL|nr:hypothetical protein DVB73_02950 [Pseudomonas plecoglossicida]